MQCMSQSPFALPPCEPAHKPADSSPASDRTSSGACTGIWVNAYRAAVIAPPISSGVASRDPDTVCIQDEGAVSAGLQRPRAFRGGASGNDTSSCGGTENKITHLFHVVHRVHLARLRVKVLVLANLRKLGHEELHHGTRVQRQGRQPMRRSGRVTRDTKTLAAHLSSVWHVDGGHLVQVVRFAGLRRDRSHDCVIFHDRLDVCGNQSARVSTASGGVRWQAMPRRERRGRRGAAR